MNMNMINERNNNIKENILLTPEEMKKNLEEINNSFNNYMKSLIKDFDESPETLQESVKYSTELIDKFKEFNDKFNLLSDEALSNKTNQNQQTNSTKSNERNKVIVDNITVKELDELINGENIKLTKTIKENDEKIKKFNEELKNLPVFKKQMK